MNGKDEIWGDDSPGTTTTESKEQYINKIPVCSLAVFYSSPSEWVNNVDKFLSDREKYEQSYKGQPTFSIKATMYESIKMNPPTTHNQKWAMLGYFAIRSIGGKKQTFKTNYLLMFARMAGYASAKDLAFNEIFDRLGVGVRTKRGVNYYGQKMKEAVMLKYDTIHIYTAPGKRGVMIMQGGGLLRGAAFEELALLFQSDRSKVDEIREMTRRAREKVKSQRKQDNV